AGSPRRSAESSSLALRTDRSPPVAPHPASRRRGYLWLQGTRLPWQGLPPCCFDALTGAPASVFDRLYSSGKILEVGCMMHARRKFYEARTGDPPRAHRALAWIGLLYDVEREAKEEHEAAEYEAFVAARHALRQERSRPIFKHLHDWLV